MNQRDEWREWSKHVLEELKRLDRNVSRNTNILGDISVEIAMLKVKAGIWGALGSLVPIIFYMIFKN